MPAYSLKPDASFYRKIVIGAVGARAVATHLAALGHAPAELERGAVGTKIWRDVKRKRVRIPDLVCTNCGQRIEVRTKTRCELSMSHSATDAERAWDFGMVPEDWVAFPVCRVVAESQWTSGLLSDLASYWHERNWANWEVSGAINYLTVDALRQTPPTRSSTKGVTEGTETSIAWDGVFSTREGTVTAVDADRITIRRSSDGHHYTWKVKQPCMPAAKGGDAISENQLIACPVPILAPPQLACSGHMRPEHIGELLASPERTLRYTAVKLVRLLRLTGHIEHVQRMSVDPHEDPYVRLEGLAALVALGFADAAEAFGPDLSAHDNQIRLEAVISVADPGSPSSVRLLGGIVTSDAVYPPFMRSAAAWSLGQIGSPEAQQMLIRTFAQLDDQVRQEALEGLVQIGNQAQAALLQGLLHPSEDVVAGCAEVLRRIPSPDQQVVEQLASHLEALDTESPASRWTVWLLAHLDPDLVAPSVLALRRTHPELYYAISVLWSFIHSWISSRWELTPRPVTI
jgi:hypothetical protein